jgi:hypothetical protein
MARYGQAPKKLILAIRDEFAVDRFLETGTHHGKTAAWAAEHFGRVVTIEASPELHRTAAEEHRRLGNVRFVLGDSRSTLGRELEALGGPAVLWLDSHWSGGDTYGEQAECPLLAELETVRASRFDHFVFIDDARLFLSPPPRPHKAEQWPTLTEVVAALTIDRPRRVLVLGDVFVAVPVEAASFVQRYAQDAVTRAEVSPAAPEAPPPSRGWLAGAKRLARRLA